MTANHLVPTDLFSLLVESVQEYGICLLDVGGRIVSWNRGAERDTGYTAAEVIGRPFDLLSTPEAAAAGEPARDLAAARDGGRVEREHLRRRKDGSTFPAVCTVTALFDAGRHVGYGVVVRATSEWSRAEEVARAGAEAHRLALKQIHEFDALRQSGPLVFIRWGCEPPYPVHSVTDNVRQFGWEADALLSGGMGWHEIIHPDDRERTHAEVAAAQTVGGPRHTGTTYRVVGKDGTVRWVYDFTVGVFDGDRRVAADGYLLDITQVKRSEADLFATDARFRAFMDHSPAAAWITDLDGRFVFVSEPYKRMFRLPAGELVGRAVADVYPPAIAAEYLTNIRKAADGPVGAVEPGVRADGSAGVFRVFKFPIPTAGGTLIGGVAVDETEQRRAEDELRAAEERFRTLVSATANIVWTTDPAGENIVSTPSWADFTGQPEEMATGWGWVEAVHPDDREQAASRWRHSLATGEPCELGYRVRRADGEWRHFAVRGVPVRAADGAVREWVGVCVDATERVRAEEGMRMRDRALQAVSQGILITDPNRPDNPVVYASPSLEVLTGYRPDEFVGRNCRFLQGKGTDPATVGELRAAVRDGKGCAVEVLNYRKDGTPFWNAVSVTPVRDAGGRVTHFIGVQADVTDRRRMEQALRQAAKMEAVGRLAGGVAHDFNNLLTVIGGFSDLLLLDTPSGDRRRDGVLQIRQAGERAAALTRQLLSFSRREVTRPVALDLNGVVAQAERMLGRLIGEDVVFDTVLDPHLPAVSADPGQIDQVVMNLCVNARDAMPTGGRLTVETRGVEFAAPPPAAPELAPGRYARLTVTDTGHGMPADVLAQIFEPFFTTKGVGQGTGLGLATVHGVVKQHSGHVAVASAVGVGTTFTVLLPAAAAAPAGKGDSHLTRPLGGSETVLLVEDEGAVRRIARISLQAQGYEVLEATDGEDALQVLAAHPGPVHLLVTDVVMPRMGGRHLADAARAARPGLRVLFVSGYTDDAVLRHGVRSAAEAFLQKPFTPLALAKRVREVLDKDT